MLKSLRKWLHKKPKPLTVVSKALPIPDMPGTKSYDNINRDVLDVLTEQVLNSNKFSELTESQRRVYIQLIIDKSKNSVVYQKIIDILTDDNI